jgi:hypothetical protein
MVLIPSTEEAVMVFQCRRLKLVVFELRRKYILEGAWMTTVF